MKPKSGRLRMLTLAALLVLVAEPSGAAGRANIVCDPDPLILNVASSNGQISVDYLGGGGGLLYAYAIKFSWDGAVASTTPGDVTEGALLSSAGTTFFNAYSWAEDEIKVDCSLLGPIDGVTGPGTMFTVDFDAVATGQTAVTLTLVAFRDRYNTPLTGFSGDDGEIQVDIVSPSVTNVAVANLTLAHTNEYAKDGDDLELTATVTDDTTLTVSDIRADLSTLLSGTGSAVPAESYVGNVATWTVALQNVTLTADGLKTVTVTATDALLNTGSDSDDVTVDNTPPGTIAGFASAPDHEKAELTWDDPTALDANLRGVVVRYDAWGDYPLYDTSAPSYPADETSGDGEAFNGLGAVTSGTHTIAPRDIYYYGAFAYDQALNYGAAGGGGQDRSTNYWLGDVAGVMGVWGYNGLVNDADIDKLGGTYAATSPTGNAAECDVGPTDDTTATGIPLPDDFVEFEDLLIFAMNYSVVSPRAVPFLPGQSTRALALELNAGEPGEDGTVEVGLRLVGNADQVKGLKAVVAFDPGELEFVEARLSSAMYSPLAPVFFWYGSGEGSVQVDLAVLGAGVTVGGSGEVAVLTFRALGDGYELVFEDAFLRGAGNENLHAALEGCESKPGIPAAFRLGLNAPNPFNPRTALAYAVPSESHVALRVYDVSGRLVRTLVDGAVEPGGHEAIWDGRNEKGHEVGSGVYFCVMEAQGFRGSTKMILMR
jgi:hypothetical protein